MHSHAESRTLRSDRRSQSQSSIVSAKDSQSVGKNDSGHSQNHPSWKNPLLSPRSPTRSIQPAWGFSRLWNSCLPRSVTWGKEAVGSQSRSVLRCSSHRSQPALQRGCETIRSLEGLSLLSPDAHPATTHHHTQQRQFGRIAYRVHLAFLYRFHPHTQP